MKFQRPLQRILLVIGLTSALHALRADYAIPFAAPPFELGKSIIGTEGWESRIAGHDQNPRVVEVRWDDDRPALLLDGASLKNAFPQTTGTRVRVTVQAAFTYPISGPKLQQFRLLIGGSPFGEIVFEGNNDAGIGFGNGSARNTRVAVPFGQLLPNHYYTISILVDYEAATYDVSITGKKRDGSPLAYEEKGVAFEVKKPFLSGLQILSTGTVRVYLRQLSIESL